MSTEVRNAHQSGRPPPAARDLVHALTRGHVDQFFAVENMLCLVAIEIAFPRRNDDSGNAVADQIAERTRHADEPVDRQHQHQPDRGNAGHRVQCRRENHDGRPGNGETQIQGCCELYFRMSSWSQDNR
jgi:hypothetical protein